LNMYFGHNGLIGWYSSILEVLLSAKSIEHLL